MSFDTEIQNDWVGVRFFCTIDGLPYVFLDGPKLKGLYKNDWTAPQTKAGSWSDASKRNYELLEYTLDLKKGLKDIGQQILRREGSTSPGSMTLRLTDDRKDTLLNLFARDKADGNTALLTSDMAHDTTGAGSVINCDDLSSWSSSGYAWIGRECMFYNKYGNDLGGTGGGQYKTIRDVFSVGSSDLKYSKNEHSNAAPRVVSDYPRVWHNRCVRVFAVLVDRDGYTLSEAGSDWFDDSNTREVFRGVLQGNPEPDASLGSWSLRVRSIDALLHTNVGTEPTEGELVRVTGGIKAQQSEQNYNAFGQPSPAVGGFFITDSTSTIDFTITAEQDKAALGADGHKAVFSYSKTLFTPGNFARLSDIRTALEDTVGAELRALNYTHSGTTYTPFEQIQVKYSPVSSWGMQDPAGLGHFIKIWVPAAGSTGGSSGNNYVTILMHGGTPTSILKVMGHPSADFTGYLTNTYEYYFYSPETSRAIAHIGVKDTTIPFFRASGQGQTSDVPPSSGYAILGEEILYYSGISDLNATSEGLYALTGCKRGQLKTTPKVHRPEVDETGKPTGDRVTLKFVQAFSDVSIFDAILQLATSTGSAHHGAFDILGHGVGPAIPPEHFDLPSFSAMKNGAGLGVWEHKINFWFDKPQKLADLIAKWLKPLGMFITARTGPGGKYQITVDQVLPPLESQAFQSLTAKNLSVDNFGSWRSGADQIVNELSVKWFFDVAEGKISDSSIVARDLDSIADYGTKGRMQWELQGYQWGYSTAIKRVYHWARRLFRAYGRPYDLLEVETDRLGWTIRPGQCVVVTTPAVPSTEGGRGLSYRAAIVLAAAHTYHAPGSAPGSKITLALEHVERQSTYVPSGRVSAYNAGTKTLTLAANSYTEASHSTDAEHFEVGDRVKVFNEGDAGTVDHVVINSISGNDIVVSAALSAVTFSASTTILTSSEHDAALQDSQRNHVYIATLTGGSTQQPFKYV